MGDGWKCEQDKLLRPFPIIASSYEGLKFVFKMQRTQQEEILENSMNEEMVLGSEPGLIPLPMGL